MRKMTREILFRGKRMDNGEWVDGFLYEHEPPFVGIVSENDVPDPSRWFILRTGFADWNLTRPIEFIEVTPCTTGQYTSLEDKNSKRIFEGDIIAIPLEEDRSPWEENCTYYENGEVYFDIERYGWYVKFPDDEISLWEFDECGVEIVGNIYDNPKLQIKRGAQGNDIQ